MSSKTHPACGTAAAALSPDAMIHGKPLKQWIAEVPAIEAVSAARPVLWTNPLLRPVAEGFAGNPFTTDDIADASARLDRFAPYIAKAFPETAASKGRIESPLRAIPAMQAKIQEYGSMSGRLLLKMDSHLPISGSIKARGGIYEVLKHAESLALAAGLLKLTDDYAVLDSPRLREFFATYSIAVGSTGNLGLSIGIISAKLGFVVTVHMSADARQWKKDLLRSKGARVVEYESDYSEAVREGRRQAEATPGCHFVDDESSRDLFLGYSVAASRLEGQLRELGVTVDAAHPLSVYLPCGVGGGPGGVAFGLKALFGDAVRCYFAEPVQAPAVLLGLATGLDDGVSVQDFGLHGHTAADGLAVGRPSALVCKAMRKMLDGDFTMEDETLYRLLVDLADTESIRLEPSALAGFPGPALVTKYERERGLAPTATHIVWATGGSMVPAGEWQAYYEQGKAPAR